MTVPFDQQEAHAAAADRWRQLNKAARARGCPCGAPATEVRLDPGTVGGVPMETWTCGRHAGVEAWDATPDGKAWRPANEAWAEARFEAGVEHGRALAAQGAVTEPELTVKKLAHHVPIVIVGRDEAGHVLYQCPARGCGDTGWIDDEGVGHCPSCENLHSALDAALEAAMVHLESVAFDPVAQADDEERIRAIVAGLPDGTLHIRGTFGDEP